MMKHFSATSSSCIPVVWFASILVFRSSVATEPVYLTEWKGFLSSPDYPTTYPANASLIWIKSVSPGNRVKITILTLQTTCDADYLEIKDGDSLASPLIARYCGDVPYTELTSSGTRVLLHFVSDGVIDVAQQGFQLQHIGDCQVHTNQTSGVITTPNYPNDYPNYMDCLWTIQLHPAMLITLECDEIAVEYVEDCTFDFVEILAGPSPDSPVLGRYCGVLNYSLTFEREGNMSIRFESDPDKEFRGFRCAYNVFKVRGYWTQWTSWTQTCRSGNQARSRTCVNPLPESGLELVCSDWADTEKRSCLGSNGSATSSSSSASPMSSFTMPSTMSSGTISSSHLDVTPSSSSASGSRSLSQFRVALLSSQTDSTIPSKLRNVTASSSQSRATLPSSQYRLTLSSRQLHVTPSQGQLDVNLSSRKFHGTSSVALTTLQEGIQSTPGLGEITFDAVEVFLILNSSIPFDRTELMADSVGQASHSLAKTSSITSGKSTAVNSPPIFKLHQSAEISIAPLPSLRQETKQKTFSLYSLANTPSQTSMTGITSHITDSTYSTLTASIWNNHQSEPSLSDSWNNRFHSNSKSSSSKAHFFRTSVHYRFTDTLAIQSVPIRNTSNIANVRFSGKTDLISDKFSSLSTTIDYSTTSTLSGKHTKGASRASLSNKVYSTPASYTRLPTQMTIDSSTESHQQHVTSIYEVTPTTPVCCVSTRWDDAVISQTHRQSYFDSLKTMKDSLMTTAKATMYTANSVSSDPTRGRSIRVPEMDSLGTVKKGTYRSSIDSRHRQNARDLSSTLEMDSLKTVKGTYSTSSMDNTHGQNTRDPSTTLQMDSLETVKKGTYSPSIDSTYGQNTRDPSSTLQIDSLPTVKGTYSAYVDQTHGKNTRDPSMTLPIDSLRTVKGVPFTVRSAYIDQTREQSTRSLSKSSQTDSLRTVKGPPDYSASKVQGSFVAVKESEKINNFQGQSHVSCFQVQPSFSSLSPITSPSNTAPTRPTEDLVTPPASQFPWHLTPFLFIIFAIIVVLLTYYLHVPDVVDALIHAIKDKRRQTKASKPNNQSGNLTKGNFSTEGFKTSLFHSYQREVFYEDELNYAFFEMEATKAIEFSVRLDDEENQSSGSEESVEISCEMEEETFDKKRGHDTLSELFDTSGNEILRKRNNEENLTTDTRRNGIIYLHDSAASYEI